ncbi:chromosome partitioning protein ParB [Nocardiopsis sp. CNR-923]|uniref:ParB/RepB/Spo0J family partition protein n=1 Tax=Nocardiopsis sp. CNR-923 TaxID=1904965 RepID=UPI0009636653|nr:ParB/RepB/Spo0J family partition protein [Nocardiopsis sp. CNR-923]OLT30766.1 chromosome partitioning protein ParB [Nocardiopsis sp. CNR-923]
MSQQRRGLGKGLEALITQGPPASSGGAPERVKLSDGSYLEEIELGAITPNPRQPRERFDDQALEELRDSISEVGVLQPVVVRGLGDEAGVPRYELIMGERRWRASKEAGLDRIPAIVRDTGDGDLLRDALLENLHRQELDALEEAAAYKQLLDDFGATHGELAQRIGRSRSHITNMLRLLNLPPKVQKRVAAKVLSAGHARALCGVEDPERQERLAERVNLEGLSVRSLEEIIALGEEMDEPEGKRARVAPDRRPNPPQVEEWASRLADRLDTTVKVDLGRRKGRIVVEFATLEDLERIVGQMDSRES